MTVVIVVGEDTPERRHHVAVSGTESPNNCVHKTTPALASFDIVLSHTGLVFGEASLPVVRARVRLVTHRVSATMVTTIWQNKRNYEII